MKPRLAWCSLFFGISALQFGCTPSNSAPAAQKAPDTPPVVVTLASAHRGTISRPLTVLANVRPYQQALLCAKVAGYLKTIAVDKGDRVHQGDLLADLEVPELVADQAKYQAEVDVATLDNDRVKAARTNAPDLVVPQALDNARGKLDIAKANLDRNTTLLGYCRITAPFSGIVTRRFVDPGAFVPAATGGNAAQNSALFELMDFNKVRVQAAVPENEVPLITNGLPVKVTLEELPRRVFEGAITRFAHALDDATKTMLAEIELPNPDGALRPGMFATVQIAIETKPDALLVPASALLIEKTKTSVFTVSGNKAIKTPVTIGFNDGQNAEIGTGLQDGTPVILLGKQTINEGQPVSPSGGK